MRSTSTTSITHFSNIHYRISVSVCGNIPTVLPLGAFDALCDANNVLNAALGTSHIAPRRQARVFTFHTATAFVFFSN